MSDSKITLYDLPCKAGNVCWSPNVLKTRLILNYKRIPYSTEWVDLPDIKSTFESYGMEPRTSDAGGASVGAQYTLPIIQLPDETFIMDSADIATHLESLYPEPSLHLESGLHDKAQAVIRPVAMALFPNLMPRIRGDVITEHALPYWVESREKLFGMSIDELAREKGGEQAWEAAKTGFSGLVKFLTEHKRDEGPFIFGSQVCYGDFIIAAVIESLRMSAQDIFEKFVGYDESIRALYDACHRWLGID